MTSATPARPDGTSSPVLPPPVSPERNDGLSVDRETRLELYRCQQRIRLFERCVYDLFLRQLIKGSTHLSLGMEAIAAGFGTAMGENDLTFATYRGHAHTLARGVPMTPVLAEVMGRENGLMGGKGGSMHLTSVEHGMLGSYAIVGAHLTIANGAAWSAQYRGTGQVVVCFFGDGTTNIGAFHEALNYAVVFRLPVVFVCENNQYMEYTPIRSVTAVPSPAADRAGSYGLDPIRIDGNDADECYLTALDALDRARRGLGPSLIEAVTYRHGGHSRADPGKYRPSAEVSAWMAYDPVAIYRSRLERLGIGEEQLAAIDEDVNAAVELAAAEAIAADVPPMESVMTEVWADGGSAWRR